MAAPNIVNVATITSKTAVLAATTSPTAIITNSAGSGKVLKATTLYVCNISSAAATVDVDLFRSSTAYRLAKGLNVPVGCTVAVIEKGDTINVEESDTLRVTASANSAIEALCAYEDIS
jgi:hypothetical protein